VRRSPEDDFPTPEKTQRVNMKYPIGVAVGFLFQPTSGKVLLQLRSADAPPNAGKWAFFGGHREPEDRGNLLTTWCREMHAELGVMLSPDLVLSLRSGNYDDGTQWHDFYYEWPSIDDAFDLTEGQRYAWFSRDEALSLPDLADYAREDLCRFREHLAQEGRLERET
jgi:8-oxo-dGTP pyrophosphatase MutT (NUDIX family)